MAKAKEVKVAWIGAIATVLSAIIAGVTTWAVATGSGHVGDLKTKVDQLQKQVKSLETNIQLKDTELGVANKQLSEKEKDNNDLRAKATKFENQRNKFEGEIQDTNEKIATLKKDMKKLKEEKKVHVNAIKALENTKLIQVYDSSRRRSGFQEAAGKIEDTFHCVIDRFAQQWNAQVSSLQKAGTQIKRLNFNGINHETKCP